MSAGEFVDRIFFTLFYVFMTGFFVTMVIPIPRPYGFWVVIGSLPFAYWLSKKRPGGRASGQDSQ